MPNPNVYGRATCHLSSFSPAVHANFFLLTSTLYYTFLPSTTASHPIYNSDIKKKKKKGEHSQRTEHSGLIHLHCLSATQLDCRTFRMKGRV